MAAGLDRPPVPGVQRLERVRRSTIRRDIRCATVDRLWHWAARALRRPDSAQPPGSSVNGSQPPQLNAATAAAWGPGRIFELIADPAQQPRWDGNDNLAGAPAGQRVRHTGEVFTMTLTHDGAIRENHVVEFEEGRRIAWRPAEPGKRPPGHLWRWELEPAGASRTRVTCTYDWTQLTDQNRFRRARATTAGQLRASIDRLAALAEAP
jgi:uncharacterized protein YndB with AHSA1/START domain